jgi:AraC-like DNA-binding protein
MPVNRAPWLFPGGARLGADNAILHARARQHRVDDYAGPLSIKTVRAGKVAWIVDGKEMVVDPSSFLILSAGERYSMFIDAPQPVETVCAFFAAGFVEGVAHDTTSPLADSLDAPERLAPALPYLSMFQGDAERALVGEVWALAPRAESGLAPSAHEEGFLMLAETLLRFYRRIEEEAARLPAVRESTKRELHRRLMKGRDYLHGHSSGAISLAEVARAACLSPYHFHRGFKQAFGQTPHEYLTALRLGEARRLIESGVKVLDAAVEVGFESPSAFSRLFRRYFHAAPSQFARSGKKVQGNSATLAV